MKRNYSKEKVDENVEAEVIGVCQLDAIEAFGEEKVFEIDTTTMAPADVASRIADILAGGQQPVRIDWMEMLDHEGRLDEYLTEDWREDDLV
jgi:adenylate kinase